jgi:hypothetical protein
MIEIPISKYLDRSINQSLICQIQSEIEEIFRKAWCIQEIGIRLERVEFPNLEENTDKGRVVIRLYPEELNDLITLT